MPREPKAINNIFKSNTALSKIAKQAQLLNRLNHTFQQSLPAQFSAHCKLANIKGDTLVIHTDNASYSSLLRFQSPLLCKILSRELETDIKILEVKVRPHFVSFKDQPSNPISLSESAATSLRQTADNMDEGPLKIALEKLAARKI
ncbi:MAG: DUF721 domain-containing protein [Methylophagaceae bacterium]